MKTFKILVVALVLFTAACSDDDEIPEIDVDSLIALLEAHPWKIDHQLVDGEEVSVVYSEEDPYIMKFGAGGVFESANFTSYIKDETWEIQDGQLLINEDAVTIETLTTSSLVISYTEDNSLKKRYFIKEEPADAFPGLSIYGKTYKVSEVIYDNEVLSPEDNLDEFRSKMFIEENTATGTNEHLSYHSWEAVSASFVFAYGDDDNDEGGVEVELKENGDIVLREYLYMDDTPKSAPITKTLESSGGHTAELSWTFTECNLWDFIAGPEWVLQEVEEDGEVVTEDLPVSLGTIWYFNPNSNQVEERDNQSDTEIEYMPWSFKESPTVEKIEVNITVEENDIRTFTMMKGNIAELELETVIDSKTYLLKFRVEEYVD